jgi:sugar lactone lactonase YvrE
MNRTPLPRTQGQSDEEFRAEPRIVADDLCFPECPRWHDGRLYVSDMHGCTVWAFSPDGARERIADVAARPAGIGFLPDGRMLLVSMLDRQVLRRDPQGLVVHADLAPFAAFHANDMVVDARGNAYVGNFGFDWESGEAPRPTRLVRVAPDGSTRPVGEELLFPNGCVTTPDGGTLIVAETFARRLTAFRIDAHGDLVDRRPWADLGPRVFPDGICLDAEGCVWVANALGGFLRVAEGGAVRDCIDLDDGYQAYACMLGGPGRRTLYLCEARGLKRSPLPPGSGRLRAVKVDVSGAGFP